MLRHYAASLTPAQEKDFNIVLILFITEVYVSGVSAEDLKTDIFGNVSLHHPIVEQTPIQLRFLHELMCNVLPSPELSKEGQGTSSFSSMQEKLHCII